MQYQSTRIVSWSYFLIHLLVEFVCFSVLYDKYGLGVSFIIAIIFDFFAFVPQALIGQLNHIFRKLDIASIGAVLMGLGVMLSSIKDFSVGIVGIVLMAIGNAMIHEAGAIATSFCGKGKLFPSALFVAGGSFGLIMGQIAGTYGANRFILLGIVLLTEIPILLTNKYWLQEPDVPKYSIVNESIGEWVVILVAFLVTAVRSFLGYAIPISWKKEIWQAILLFFTMGAGKAVGGYLADRYGAKKVAVWATLCSVPFLLMGNHIMVLSIIGVFLFSMTMSITFGMLLSVINNNSGLAFGVTTLALFVGVYPVLIYGTFGTVIDSILIVVCSIGCAFCLNKTLK